MSIPPLRMMFQSHNRRGLGHLMRGLNIARSIRQLVPASHILFYTRNTSGEALCGRDFECFVETDAEGFVHWADLARLYRPDAIVYDTLLPKGPGGHPAGLDARAIYVMRKCKPERQHEIFASRFLEQVDLVLIPHTPDEFGYPLPASIVHKSQFVGPIARPLNARTQAALRAKYALDPADFLLVSTPGGGGFAGDAATFFATVLDVHQRVAGRVPRLRHLVVQGPHSEQPFEQQPGMTLIGYEPELVNLFALANLVIAEGGYNTVNELRLAGAPAVFLPGARTYDDQEERVRALERQGMARVFAERDAPWVAEQIAEICASEPLLSAMRQRSVAARTETGNAAAAAHIVALLDRAREPALG